MKRVLKWLLVLVVVLGCVALLVQQLPQFGASSTGDRRARIDASSDFEDGKAQNLIETDMGINREVFPALRRYIRGGQEPDVELPVENPKLSAPSDDAFTLTWWGHSSVLLEMDGIRIVTDPMLSKRASPFQWMGPSRFHKAPVSVDDLPKIDAVVISHDHYDHLDMDTISALMEQSVLFFVPLGVGAHLESWGVPPDRIRELEWWQETKVGDVRLVCTPARHFSGRGLTDRNRTLWASWAMIGPTRSVWYSGDTGAFPQASEIGERLGPFDLSMIEIGAYDPAWKVVHTGPDEALNMHEQVRGEIMFPTHWGSFNLAPHRWDQPVVRLVEQGGLRGIPLLIPEAGRTMPVGEAYVAAFWKERVQLWKDLGRDTLDE